MNQLPAMADAQPIELEARESQLAFPTVAIGASAGGVEALIRFFRAIPPDSGCAFVVAMHLPSERASMLAPLIGAATRMRVEAAADDTALQPDHVYVAPPGRYLAVIHGRIELEEIGVRPSRPVVIDRMMMSLAADQHERAIGVVLSGADADGSLGIKAIKGEGGLTLAQLPASAAHPGMPQSAVSTGLIDRQLQIEEMPGAILDFVRHAGLMTAGDQRQARAASEILPSILEQVREQAGADFRGYRAPMLLRRVRRRMGLCRIGSESEYLQHLVATPSEARALAADFLISVTEFFREPASWQALVDDVLPGMLKARSAGDTVRVWVPGCASGEEAYSVAMVLLEQPLLAERRLEVQIFASDIDRNALEVARKGLYPSGIETGVGRERLQRFFVSTPEGYQVRSELREVVLFAPQNVVNDPPFSRLHLISCRNLLIYMEPELQRRVLRTFHFALNVDGILTLGKSENVPSDGVMFVPVSQRARIFRRVGPARVAAPDLPLPDPGQGAPFPVRATTHDVPAYDRLIRENLHGDGDIAAVVTDARGRALYLHGPLQPYLREAGDIATNDLFSDLRSELRMRLRTVLHMAATHPAPAQAVVDVEGADPRPVRLAASRLGDVRDDLFLVTIERIESPGDTPAIDTTHADDAVSVRALAAELRLVKRELRATIEDLESTNEELKVANEEAMSMNEELQSSNEELATSKEELQSMNEEIVTVNGELQDKVAELETVNNDLVNLLSSTHIPTLFLDREMRIKRFTPAATRLFRLIPGDIDRPLTDIASVSDLGSLVDDVQQVLASLAPVERETRTAAGECYLRRTLAYRTLEDHIEGVVVTFTDITEIKRSAEELRRYAAVMQGSNDSVIVYDANGRILAWNQGAQAMYGYDENDALHTPIERILPSEALPEFREHLRRVLAGERIAGVEVRRRRKDGTALDVSASFSLITEGDGRPASIALTERDISPRKKAEVELRESEERFRKIADNAPVLIWLAGDDGALEFVNGQFAAFTGLPRDRLLGRRWIELLHRDDRASVVLPGIDEGASKRRMEATARLQDADGTWRWMKITATPRVSVPGWVGTLVNIDDQVNAELALRQANQRKDDFLAMLGHELRNPLVPIRNAAEVLDRVAGGDNRIGWVRDTLVRQVDHVTRLVDDLLDISLITRRAMRLHLEPVELRAVAKRACDSMQEAMKRKRHRFECHFDDAPLWVEGDGIRLTQIIENLLTNAAKYTHDGGSIEMQLSREAQHATIRVSDDGVGIAPSMLERVFDLFVQDERSVDRSEGGLGIGLALVRHLVELHGGSVAAYSEGLGKGTEITIRLPLLPEPSIPRPQEQAPGKAGATGRVLIVDDDPDVGESTSVLLEMLGYEVEHAANLEQALEVARRLVPQVVLLDLAMPHADGYEVMKRLRALPELEGAVYLSVSGFGQPEDYRRSERAGFERHLVKPVNPAEFDRVLRMLLEPGQR